LADVLELYDADPTQGKQIMRTLEYGFQHIREIDERIEELLEIRAEMLEFAASFLRILEREEGKYEESKEFKAFANEVIRELEEREFGAGIGSGNTFPETGLQDERAI